MVLKRQLPSRISKNQPQKEANTSAPKSEENQLITDFVVTPEDAKKAPDQSSSAKTDPFTADALKEAANALAKEMNTDRPKSDLYLDDPFEEIPPHKAEPKAEKPQEFQKDQEIIKETQPTPESQKTEPEPKKAPEQPAPPASQDVRQETPENTPQQTTSGTENKAPLPDVFGQIDDATPFTPKRDTSADVEAPQPADAQQKEAASTTAQTSAPSAEEVQNNPMRRKVRNKRKRAKYVAPEEANTSAPEPTASAGNTPKETAPEIQPSSEKGPHTPDMEIAPEHKRNAEQDVKRAFQEIEGIEHPADQEIEAAYIPQPEISEDEIASASKPNIDITTLGSAPQKKEPTNTDAPQKATDQPKEPQNDLQTTTAPASFTPPPSFAESTPQQNAADTPASSEKEALPVEATSKGDTTPQKPAKEHQKEAQKAPKEQPKEAKPVQKEPSPTPIFTPPTSFAEISESDKKVAPLPWEEEAHNSQELETQDDGSAWDFTAAAAITPKGDIFAPDAEPASEKQVAPESSDNTPKNPQKAPPPELPDSDKAAISSTRKTNPLKAVATLAVLGFVIFLGVKLLTGKDNTQETVARFTGALVENTENLPKNMGGATNQPTKNKELIQPEKVISNAELNRLNQELEADLALLDPPKAPTQPKAEINFVDVTQEEANKPIVADADAEIPGEKGFVASLQDAIKKERSKGQPTSDTQASGATEEASRPKADRYVESKLLQQQVEAELEAYRKALSENNTPLPIKPDSFFGTVNEYGVLMDQPKSVQTPDQEVFTENPYNLPVIAEPESEPKPTVRTLDHFDVAMFEPPKPKVRIPKNLKPRLRASDFPEMTVLSLIPNKGLIAHINDREGVLLIGEMLEGWELFAVTPEHAEFRSGERKFYININ